MLNKNNDDNTADPRDVEAEAEAAEARRRGTELVAGHLSRHLEQNPDSSYVTWIACLHPENAEVTIDERFFTPNNPWWTVYEGAKSEIPTATATPVTEPLVVPQAGNGTNPSTNESKENESEKSNCNCLDLIIGWTLCLTAILSVFAMELIAYICYCVSAGFYRLAKAMEPPTACSGILYSVFLLVYYVLALVDAAVLLTSVLVTEIVAGCLWLLSGLFAGCTMAKRWHQYLRRTCHLTRWAFRSESLSAYPPRQLCCVCLSRKDKGEEKEPTAPTGTASADLAPSAPPSTEDVIVLDERDVIVEIDNAFSNHKDAQW